MKKLFIFAALIALSSSAVAQSLKSRIVGG
jgi:hypothetical protein